MKWGWFKGKRPVRANSLEDSKRLTNLLVALSGIWETPALIAYLADDRARLLLCKALVSPLSEYDRQLARRALDILRSRGMDAERLRKKLGPAAVALGLVSTCDVQIDYYHALGLNPSATASELRAAYRKKAFELHPDTARDTAESSTDFMAVKAAYDTLIDPKSRAAFDQCRLQLVSWHEKDTKASPGKRSQRRPPGRIRKATYRIAALVAVMILLAWVISIVHEHETMVELAQVTSSTIPGSAREMSEPDPGEVENKGAPGKPLLDGKTEDVEATPIAAAGTLTLGKRTEVEEKPTPALEPVTSPQRIEIEEPRAEPAPEPVEGKVLPFEEGGKSQAASIQESREKKPKEVMKPTKTKKNMETSEPAKKKTSYPAAQVLSKSLEKPSELPIQQASIPSDSDNAAGNPSPSTDKDTTKETEFNVSEMLQTNAPAVSKDASPSPAPPHSSIQVATNPPGLVFPAVPVPETHETSFIKRSQILAFLKEYTAAYERGNAETFFSFFTANAMENGKALNELRPDYRKLWDNVKSLNYRISVNETEQVMGTDMVSMTGRFDLDWKFMDGRSGQSHGEIFMDLKLNETALRVSRLSYRFDGE